MKLDDEPSGDITISPEAVTSDNIAMPSFNFEPSQLTFTKGNWNQDQTITVTANTTDIPITDSDRDYIIVHTASGTGAEEGPIIPPDVKIKVLPKPGIILSTNSLEIPGSELQDNKKSSKMYSIMLSGVKPNDEEEIVSINLSLQGDPSGITIRPKTLEFKRSNWNGPRSVMVTIDSRRVSLGEEYTITHSAVSENKGYQNISQPELTFILTKSPVDKLKEVLLNMKPALACEVIQTIKEKDDLKCHQDKNQSLTKEIQDLTPDDRKSLGFKKLLQIRDIPDTVSFEITNDDLAGILPFMYNLKRLHIMGNHGLTRIDNLKIDTVKPLDSLFINENDKLESIVIESLETNNLVLSRFYAPIDYKETPGDPANTSDDCNFYGAWYKSKCESKELSGKGEGHKSLEKIDFSGPVTVNGQLSIGRAPNLNYIYLFAINLAKPPVVSFKINVASRKISNEINKVLDTITGSPSFSLDDGGPIEYLVIPPSVDGFYLDYRDVKWNGKIYIPCNVAANNPINYMLLKDKRPHAVYGISLSFFEGFSDYFDINLLNGIDPADECSQITATSDEFDDLTFDQKREKMKSAIEDVLSGLCTNSEDPDKAFEDKRDDFENEEKSSTVSLTITGDNIKFESIVNDIVNRLVNTKAYSCLAAREEDIKAFAYKVAGKRIAKAAIGAVIEKAIKKIGTTVIKKVAVKLVPMAGQLSLAYDAVDLSIKGFKVFHRFQNWRKSDNMLDYMVDFLVQHGPALESGDFDLAQAFSGKTFALPLSFPVAAEHGDLDQQDASQGHTVKAGFRASFDYTKFSDREGDFSIDGQGYSYILGFDIQPKPFLDTGLSLLYNITTADYENTDSTYDIQSGGTLDTTLISVHPFVKWKLSNALSLYGSVGYGRGNTKLTIDDVADSMFSFIEGSSRESEGNYSSFTAGIGYTVWQSDTTELALKLDGTTTTFLDSSSQQARLTTALSHDFVFDAGVLTNGIDLSLVMSDTDPAVVELAGRMGWRGEDSRFSGSTRARILLFAGERKEWGVGGSLSFHPLGNGEGLDFEVRPTIGRTGQRFFEEDSFLSILEDSDLSFSGDATYTPQLSFELGYGFRTGNAVLTPYTDLFLTEGSNTYAAGLRYNLDNGLKLDLEGAHKARTSGNNDNSVSLGMGYTLDNGLELELEGTRTVSTSGNNDNRVSLEFRLPL